MPLLWYLVSRWIWKGKRESSRRWTDLPRWGIGWAALLGGKRETSAAAAAAALSSFHAIHSTAFERPSTPFFSPFASHTRPGPVPILIFDMEGERSAAQRAAMGAQGQRGTGSFALEMALLVLLALFGKEERGAMRRMVIRKKKRKKRRSKEQHGRWFLSSGFLCDCFTTHTGLCKPFVHAAEQGLVVPLQGPRNYDVVGVAFLEHQEAEPGEEGGEQAGKFSEGAAFRALLHYHPLHARQGGVHRREQAGPIAGVEADRVFPPQGQGLEVGQAREEGAEVGGGGAVHFDGQLLQLFGGMFVLVLVVEGGSFSGLHLIF